MNEAWTRTDRLVSAEIASAVKLGKTITGAQIVTMTGLSIAEVAETLRKLGKASLIQESGHAI